MKSHGPFLILLAIQALPECLTGSLEAGVTRQSSLKVATVEFDPNASHAEDQS